MITSRPGARAASDVGSLESHEDDPSSLEPHRRKRLLFVYRFCGLGGVETSLLHKVRALRARGFDAHALLFEPYGAGGEHIARYPEVVLAGKDRAAADALLAAPMAALVLIDYPELLDQLHDRGIEAPVIFETHSAVPSSWERFHGRLRDPRIAAICVPSRYNQELVRERARAGQEVLVIPNALELDLLRPRRLALTAVVPEAGPQEQLVLWVGRLEDEKNPLELVEAGQRLLDRRGGVRFVIVGDTPEYEQYRARLEAQIRPEARSRFTFRRAVPYGEMSDLYAAAARSGGQLMSTSRHESAPMTFLEAMAAGCPILSSDVGGVRELLDEGRCGALYPCGDIAAAVAALDELLGDEASAFRKGLVERAYARVVQRHDPHAVAALYTELIARLGDSSTGEGTARQEAGSPPSGPRRHRHARRREPSAELVSTIIPVRNRPRLVREAVASVLAQTHRPIEILLVDDGSDDETPQVCDLLARDHQCIRVIHAPHQGGRPGLVRELGRLQAQGGYVQYLDSDDLLHPRKFERMVAALRARPECDIAYCYTRRYLIGDIPRDEPAGRTGQTFERMLPEFLAGRFWFTSTALYTRRAVDLAGPWSDLPFWEDIEYDMRLAALGARPVHCRDILADFRDHSGERLSRGGFYRDPKLLPHGIRAYLAVFDHARRGGVDAGEPAASLFLEDIRSLAEWARRLGLESEAERCFALLHEVAGASPPPDDPLRLAATLEPQTARLSGTAGGSARIPVRVANTGNVTLRATEFLFGLSYHLRAPDGGGAHDNPRSYFHEPLHSGEERIVSLPIQLPPVPGAYQVEIDLVWEHVTWFRDAGNAAPVIELEVTPEAEAPSALGERGPADATHAPQRTPRRRQGEGALHRLARSLRSRLRLGLGIPPLSEQWGTDRGLPIHRYYLEEFLSEFAADVRGHCLEFQDPQYAPRFGGKAIDLLDILHVDHSNPRATLVADLTRPNVLPSDAFDCIVCTHVLHVIADVATAVRELHRILRPGGVLLVAVPHVSMNGLEYSELWRFTPLGLETLLASIFGAGAVTIRAYGNSLAAAAELRGLVSDELTGGELKRHDPRFAVEVCARAVKRSAGSGSEAARGL